MSAVWDVKMKLLYSEDNYSLNGQHGKKIKKSYICQGIICKGGGDVQTEIITIFLRGLENAHEIKSFQK